MENVLEIIVQIWSVLSILWLVSFLFRTKTKISDGGSFESGKNVNIKKNWDGNYDFSSTPIYSYTGPIYDIKYSKLGVIFRGVGSGGIASAILFLGKDFLTEIACLCSLGMIDVRENDMIVYGCIIGIAALVTIMSIAINILDSY